MLTQQAGFFNAKGHTESAFCAQPTNGEVLLCSLTPQQSDTHSHAVYQALNFSRQEPCTIHSQAVCCIITLVID